MSDLRAEIRAEFSEVKETIAHLAGLVSTCMKQRSEPTPTPTPTPTPLPLLDRPRFSSLQSSSSSSILQEEQQQRPRPARTAQQVRSSHMNISTNAIKAKIPPERTTVTVILYLRVNGGPFEEVKNGLFHIIHYNTRRSIY
jgi:hypothetical protein